MTRPNLIIIPLTPAATASRRLDLQRIIAATEASAREHLITQDEADVLIAAARAELSGMR